MCSVCSGILKQSNPHSEENCPYKNALRCRRCRKRGHTLNNCPDKHFLRFQTPMYLEQLIPESYRTEYGITSYTLIQSDSSKERVQPNLCAPKYLEDLISPNDIETYGITTKTPLPNQQGPPKSIHKSIYEVVNTASFFRHVVMCHNEQPSQIMENNIGFTLGYAIRQGYEISQIQQDFEIPLKEAIDSQQNVLDAMKQRLARMKKLAADPNHIEILYKEYKTVLEELSRELSQDNHIQSNVHLMKELIARYGRALEDGEAELELLKKKMATEYEINLLPSQEQLKECRKRVLELEKKRAKKAKLVEEEKAARQIKS